jgi:predicted transcriptional regulator
MADDQQLKTELELIKKDMSTVNLLVDKFDIAIDKLSEISDNMNKILAVHEIRLEHQQKAIESFEKKFDDHKEDHKKENELLHHRISTKEVEIKNDIKENFMNIQKNFDDITKRLECIERWRWYILGAIATSLFVITQLDIKLLF